MNVTQTELTPELAARLLSNPHPKQRRAAPQTVAVYATAMSEGRWRLVPDPILVDPEGQLFNGAHRCSAVIASKVTIPVMISWDADPEIFDLIDVGRRRSAYQFVREGDAALRASAARVTLWYAHRFALPPGPKHFAFDLQQLMEELERQSAAFEVMVRLARQTYDYTSLAPGVILAVFALAYGDGYQQEVEAFVEGVTHAADRAADDPARLLAERFIQQRHRARRRTPAEDWTILVRALNAAIEGRPIQKLQISDVWPRIGEREREYVLRQRRFNDARRRDIQVLESRIEEARAAHRKIGAG